MWTEEKAFRSLTQDLTVGPSAYPDRTLRLRLSLWLSVSGSHNDKAWSNCAYLQTQEGVCSGTKRPRSWGQSRKQEPLVAVTASIYSSGDKIAIWWTHMDKRDECLWHSITSGCKNEFHSTWNKLWFCTMAIFMLLFSWVEGQLKHGDCPKLTNEQHYPLIHSPLATHGMHTHPEIKRLSNHISSATSSLAFSVSQTVSGGFHLCSPNLWDTTTASRHWGVY